MSDLTNQALIDKVEDLLDYYTSNIEGRILQADLDRHDLEALKYHADLFYKQMMLEQDQEGGVCMEPYHAR